MAPEQLSGGPITPRTDLYGLGVVLHEALTGRQPYPAKSPVALADAQRAGPPDARRGRAGAGQRSSPRCLAFDPADRPLHAGALAAALRAWLAGDPAPAMALAPAPAAARPVGRTQTQPIVAAAAAAPPPVASAAPDEVRGAGPRWRRWPGLPALVLLGLVAFAALRPDAGGQARNDARPRRRRRPHAHPSPTATPSPPHAGRDAADWLAGLIAEVEDACGDEAAAEAARAMEGMGRGEARR